MKEYRNHHQRTIIRIIITFIVILLLGFPLTFAQHSNDLQTDLIVGYDDTITHFIHPISYESGGYILDQYQIRTNNHRYTAYGWYLVQSFKPSMSLLTKIDVLFEIKGLGSQGENLEMTIKDRLDTQAEPMATSTISYSDLDGKEVWVEFYFDNVTVIPDETYYMFINQQGAGDCYWYGIYNNDYYERGYAYGYNMGLSKWENLSDAAIFPDFDFCFKTYSYGDNFPPSIIEITGPTNGKPNKEYEYTITAVDNDQDDVYISIDWGDETDTGWMGPYDSDQPVTISHTWDERGSYTISARAKDLLGNLGEWNTIEVSMPNNKFILFEHGSLLELLKQIIHQWEAPYVRF